MESPARALHDNLPDADEDICQQIVSEGTSMKMTRQKNSGYACLMSGNNRETGRILPVSFCPVITYYLQQKCHQIDFIVEFADVSRL